MSAIIATGAAALAVWLWSGRRDEAGDRMREPPLAPGDGRTSPAWFPWRRGRRRRTSGGAAEATLTLEMLRVAIARGSSLPGAFLAVGGALGGTTGAGLTHAGEALNRGASWREAWVGAAGVVASHAGDGRRGGGPRGRHAAHGGTRAGPAPDGAAVPAGGADPGLFAILEAALEPTWTHGASPVEPLRLAAERIDRDERDGIERAAGKLSVHLLLPCGLCFLPAFVFIGVVPAIASFAW